jgi:hypothetical protein
VISVTVAERELDDYDRDSIRKAGATTHSQYENNTHFGLPSAHNGYMRLVETCQIADMRQLHQMLMEEGDASKKGYTGYDLRYIAVHYLMKDGSTMTRHYYTHLGSPVMEQLKNYGSSAEYILEADSVEAIMEHLQCAYWGNIKITDRVWLNKLATALYEDGQARQLDIEWDCEGIRLVYDEEDGSTREIVLRISPRIKATLDQNKHTRYWMQEFVCWYLFVYRADTTKTYLTKIRLRTYEGEYSYELSNDLMQQMITALSADATDGKLVHNFESTWEIVLSLQDEEGKYYSFRIHPEAADNKTTALIEAIHKANTGSTD